MIYMYIYTEHIYQEPLHADPLFSGIYLRVHLWPHYMAVIDDANGKTPGNDKTWGYWCKMYGKIEE